jgi:glycosidase
MINQSRNVSMSSLLKKHLDFLYPDQSAELYDQVLDLVGDFQEGSRKTLNHSDALLITYPHQIYGDGEDKSSPLKVLSRFYSNRLKDSFSGVHLLPFYPSTSDGGFAVSSYNEVDPEFGSWEDISVFHCDLMFDGVFNHTSSEHHWFQSFLKCDEKYTDFYHHFDSKPESGSELEKQLQLVVRPRSSGLLAEFEKADHQNTYVWATFGADQLDVNFATPRVFLEFIKVLLDYASKGAHYIRIDAVPFLWKELGTNCMHHPKTHSLVKSFRAVLDLKYPEVQLITESNVPHHENISYLDDGHSEAQLVYNFSLAPLIMYSLLENDSSALKGWVSNLELLPGETTFFNFTATHDGIGVRPLEGIIPDEDILRFTQDLEVKDGLINYRSLNGVDKPYEVNITWASGMHDENQELHIRKILCSYSMSLVFPGVPGFYFHNLVGTLNDIEGYNKTAHNRDINRRKFTNSELEYLISDHPFHSEVFRRTVEILEKRRSEKIFHPQAHFRQLDSSNDLWVVEREWQGQTGLFIHNVSPKTQEFRGLTIEPYDFKWVLS